MTEPLAMELLEMCLRAMLLALSALGVAVAALVKAYRVARGRGR